MKENDKTLDDCLKEGENNQTKLITIEVYINPFLKFLNNFGITQEYVIQGEKVKPGDLSGLLKNYLGEGEVYISENKKEPMMILPNHLNALSRGYMPNFYLE